MWRPGHFFLLVALAAACLLSQTQAIKIMPERRSVIGRANENDNAGLFRRWWLGDFGSLTPLKPGQTIKSHIHSRLHHHRRAVESDYQKTADSLAHQPIRDVVVSIDRERDTKA